MNLTNNPEAVSIAFSDTHIIVELRDERILHIPLHHFPRLLAGSEQQRANWRFIDNGGGIHWEDLDEDLSVAGFLGIEQVPPKSEREKCSISSTRLARRSFHGYYLNLLDEQVNAWCENNDVQVIHMEDEMVVKKASPHYREEEVVFHRTTVWYLKERES